MRKFAFVMSVFVFLAFNAGIMNVTCDLKPQGPTIFVYPGENIVVYKGQTFNIRVKIFNLTAAWVPDPEFPLYKIPLGNLYGFDMKLTWSTTYLTYTPSVVRTVPYDDYPPAEYIYRDEDSSGAVSGNDARLTAVGVYSANSTVADAPDLGNSLIGFIAEWELHRDNVLNDTAYTLGEYIYMDYDGSNDVSEYDYRLSNVYYPGGCYFNRTWVEASDNDTGCGLFEFKSNEKHSEDIPTNSTYDPGEKIYQDTDSSSTVSVGDLRLSPPGGLVARDTDIGKSIVAFKSNVSPYERHSENVKVNGAYNPGEFIYRDVDTSGTVTVGDVRLSNVYYPGGCYFSGTVASGDPDIGRTLVSFTSNEKHREDNAANGLYDPPTVVYSYGTLHGPLSESSNVLQPGSYQIGRASMSYVNEGTGEILYIPPSFNNPANSTVFIIKFTPIKVGTTNLLLPIADLKLSDNASRPIGRDQNGNPLYLHIHNATVRIKIPGDVDGIGGVAPADIGLFKLAYGTNPSKPNWDAMCNFNNDTQVDFSDLFLLGRNYGKTEG